MRVRRVKPYVCVDCDYPEHFRFQETKDIDAAAGTWLRCLVHSRAQEQDGIVKAAWLRRTFATTYERVDELVSVGLLRPRGDGDYEIHAYAPRNQTRAMLHEGLAGARDRMATTRGSGGASKRRGAPRDGTEHAPNKRRTSDPIRGDVRPDNGPNKRRTAGTSRGDVRPDSGPNMDRTRDADDPDDTSEERLGDLSSPSGEAPTQALSGALLSPIGSLSALPEGAVEDGNGNAFEMFDRGRRSPRLGPSERANNERKSAVVPTSTSTSTSPSTSSSFLSLHEGSDPRGGSGGTAGAGRANGVAEVEDVPPRDPLPASERALSGALWLQAFSAGVTDHTHRPCTAGRVYLGTLERIVTHHAPKRDVASACEWLREQARAFAVQWDGKHPAKGLSPDGLERWLNDGRRGPPEFGRPRIVQPAAEDWHEDDWSDLGAEVVR